MLNVLKQTDECSESTLITDIIKFLPITTAILLDNSSSKLKCVFGIAVNQSEGSPKLVQLTNVSLYGQLDKINRKTGNRLNQTKRRHKVWYLFFFSQIICHKYQNLFAWCELILVRKWKYLHWTRVKLSCVDQFHGFLSFDRFVCDKIRKPAMHKTPTYEIIKWNTNQLARKKRHTHKHIFTSLKLNRTEIECAYTTQDKI